MRNRICILLFAVLASRSGHAGGAEEGLRARIAHRGDGLIFSGDGRLVDAFQLPLPAGGISRQRIEAMLGAISRELFDAPAPDLRLVEQSESLAGVHFRYQQYAGDIPVIGGQLTVDVDAAGTTASLHNRTAGRIWNVVEVDSARAERAIRLDGGDPDSSPVEERSLVYLRVGDDARRAWRIVTRRVPLEPVAWYVDAATGEVLREEPLYWNKVGSVFDPNPVVTLNDATLQDHDDAASAVPARAYQSVDLPDLSPSGSLSGPNVRIFDFDAPHASPVDAAGPLTLDRSHTGFEEVMAYYHLDRSQRYLQSLGFAGARRIIRDPIDVDAHAVEGADNSYYLVDTTGKGRLYFGDGGTDDAEDADILLHEYGHAIQDAIAPAIFSGASSSQARAMAEGFGDYWAFSGNYAATVRSGRDPFCIADWDARCAGAESAGCSYPAGADCLRRIDSTATFDDFIVSSQRGTEHRNGQIWSSALRRLFMSLVIRNGLEEGRRIADRIVLEGTFGMPPSPTFGVAGRKLVEADRLLYGGAHREEICSSLAIGRILSPAECGSSFRGEVTFFQSIDSGIAIPDGDPSGIVSPLLIVDPRPIDRILVSVHLEHSFRGDLQIDLLAPDGRVIPLQNASGLPGRDLDVVYGLSSETSGSLELLRGVPAAGTWKLRVVDTRLRDTGTLISWGLTLRFEGDAPSSARPSMEGPRRHLLVAAHVPGAQGSFFRSDVRIANRGASHASVMAVFTPSAADGRSTFAAVKLSILPGQTLALDDALTSLFGVEGIGSIELTGDVRDLRVTSRIYTSNGGRTYGQFVDESLEEQSTSLDDESLHIPQLQNTNSFRSNIGFTELAGGSGRIRVLLYDGEGSLARTDDYSILPFSHLQTGVIGLGGAYHPVLHAEVRVIEGTARIAGYGSVIDNISGDAIFVPAARIPSFPRAVVVPVAVNAPGIPPTSWRSDLWLTDGSGRASSAAPSLFPLPGEKVDSGALTVAPLGSIAVPDVVSALFHRAGAIGQIAFPQSRLLVSTRTWTPGVEGSLGQFIAGRDIADAIQREDPPVEVSQVVISDHYRTNVGATEVRGLAVGIRIRLFDGGGREVFRHELGMAPNQQTQFNLEGLGAPRVRNGRLTFEVVSGDGGILGYASVVDNVSGDSYYVPAR